MARKKRDDKPEHIQVGAETFERNDLTAKRYGESERSLNRKDVRGAPLVFIAGVKYRPVERYDRFMLAQIKQMEPPRRRCRAA
jgi:hypothetical protein